MTPIAGACWAWSEAFRSVGYDSFCVCPSGYRDGRAMPADCRWPPNATTIDRIRDADVIFAYQGYPYKFDWYPRDHPTVGVYVSQPERHIWRALEYDGWPWCVDGEYQTRLYGPLAIPVPECLPLDHEWYRPGPKPEGHVRIVYSPSNRHLTGWDDKGYAETNRILMELAVASGNSSGIPPVDVDIIMGKPLGECLLAKATAHIVIDECVTGAFHGNSIQGLAHGSVVINNADALCMANIRTMTGGSEAPFVRCDMDELAGTLRRLVELGPSQLELIGRLNRQWAETAWDTKALIDRNFVPLIEKAMAKCG